MKSSADHTPAVSRGRAPFLRATWKYLAIVNYEVPPALLQPYLPYGTELDSWQSRVYVSLVGFRFLDTRVLGISIPFHSNFDEVNLRFYVRRKEQLQWRRGVVFIKEYVPRYAIAAVARYVYNENYSAVPMSHQLVFSDAACSQLTSVQYRWGNPGREMQIDIECAGAPQECFGESEAEYITEHYWGYTKQRDGSTLEYQVTHPRWRVWNAASVQVSGDAEFLYSSDLVGILKAKPYSAYVAEGSAVNVHRGIRVRD
jgi:uncharacterized protein YqjF (DUF2071 family)